VRAGPDRLLRQVHVGGLGPEQLRRLWELLRPRGRMQRRKLSVRGRAEACSVQRAVRRPRLESRRLRGMWPDVPARHVPLGKLCAGLSPGLYRLQRSLRRHQLRREQLRHLRQQLPGRHAVRFRGLQLHPAGRALILLRPVRRSHLQPARLRAVRGCVSARNRVRPGRLLGAMRTGHGVQRRVRQSHVRS
jgi:hypothetical protein